MKRRASASRAGQSLVESCLAILLVCLIFMGLLQVAMVVAASDVLSYAAACGNRAKTVGFNRWMVTKSVLAAVIPSAGHIREPAFVNDAPALRAALAAQRPGVVWDRVLRGDIQPPQQQLRLEQARIPEFMDSANDARARFVLDYEGWDNVRIDPLASSQLAETRVRVRQDFPLRIPFARAFYAADSVPLAGESVFENHYPLYLDDMGW